MNMRRRNSLLVILALLVALAACAKRPASAPAPPPPAPTTPPPAVVRSQRPSEKATVIQHCVVTKQENANTVTCECDQVSTRIDASTGRTALVCRAVRQK
jgi:hypothetical protein